MAAPIADTIIVENQVDPRPRRQDGEPLQQLQRIEAQVRRAVRPAVPQREADRPLGTDAQPVLRECRPQRVATKTLAEKSCSSLMITAMRIDNLR